jgi:cyclophilin family peptidyl-prolyl cis-trans isomerase
MLMRAGFPVRWASGVLCAVGVCILQAGCGQNAEKQAANPRSGPGNGATPAITSQQDGGTTPASGFPAISLLPFKDAVLFEPPEGEQRPPDKTMAGKNVGALFEAIAGQDGSAGLWDKIALTTTDGRPLQYAALVKTDLGTITIELYPAAAPNHVRNFIALARAGYFNGLVFHRSLNKQVPGEALPYLEAGCPLGTGEAGLGSIGYWLKPEIAPTLTHEEGSVGAVRGEAVDSAACKFYVTLAKAPAMDGGYTLFGKITRGLDVAHIINDRPNVEDGDFNDRPRTPVVIQEVTIQVGVGNAAVVAQGS